MMINRRTCLAALTVLLGLGHAVTSSAQNRYKVFDSGVDFSPIRISQSGMMAGQEVGSFAFDRLDGLSQILPFSGWQIWAEDVNVSGTVVGATFLNNKVVSFIWMRSSGTQLLDDFNGKSTYAYGINDQGEVVGKFGVTIPAAYLWRPGQGWVLLPPKYGGACGAHKINNVGEILGYTQLNDTTTRVIWRPDGTIIDMGNMAPQYQNFANDINDNGYVCGGTFGPLGNVGYIWNPNGESYTAIHNPYSPGSYLTAKGMNDANYIVGRLFIDGVGWKGFIRHPNGQITLLNSFLDSSSQGWDIQDAYDINNKGQISGVGFRNGQRRGVLLQPIKDRTPISIGGVGR